MASFGLVPAKTCAACSGVVWASVISCCSVLRPEHYFVHEHVNTLAFRMSVSE